MDHHYPPRFFVPVIDLFIYNFICLDYMRILQEKWSAYDNKFGKIKFNDLYGLVITEIMMNIMSCHGFSESTISTVIFMCLSALVPHYFSKGFLFLKKKKLGLKTHQKKLSRKSMLLHYMTKKYFWCVNKQYHQLLKHWTRLLFQEMCMIIFSLIFMMKGMLNYIPNSFNILSNNTLNNLAIKP